MVWPFCSMLRQDTVWQPFRPALKDSFTQLWVDKPKLSVARTFRLTFGILGILGVEVWECGHAHGVHSSMRGCFAGA